MPQDWRESSNHGQHVLIDRHRLRSHHNLVKNARASPAYLGKGYVCGRMQWSVVDGVAHEG